MIIQPSIRSNVFTNAHPLGCKEHVLKQIKEAKLLGKIKGPKNVLIIGGSSGYGLSSRIALAFGAKSNTVNVSFESAPKGKRSGTAGWWNNIFFQEFAEKTGSIHKDFVGDAFSSAMKKDVINYVKKHLGKIDLIVYSLAAGARKDETTGEVVHSHIKTIGEDAKGKTIDIAKMTVKDIEVTSATKQEVNDTVFVMGGSDWAEWIKAFDEKNLLNTGFKTVAYTYVGGPVTTSIYRGGTLGKAKEDLEQHANRMDELIKRKYHGEVLVSSSKAVATKASVFIPQMTIYISCLFDVMARYGIHETITQHKFRLFNDMIYGTNRLLDNKARIRIDHKEMQERIQKETVELMDNLTDEELLDLPGTHLFVHEFYQIHGFGFDSINYNEPVDMEMLSALKPK